MFSKKPLIIAGLLALTAVFLNAVGFEPKQILATSVFLLVICGTLFYWKFRLAFAFSGIALLLGAHLITVHGVVEHAGLDIILFLVGMMTLIGFLEERNFFEYIIAKIVDKVGHHAFLLLSVLMGLAAFSAALVDEVTSILFMISAMFHLTKRYKVNPIPFLLMLVFATNVGSSATAVGNPIGVMIAMRGHFSFADFLRWASPNALLALSICIPLCLLIFKKAISELGANMKAEKVDVHESDHIKFKKSDIRLCWIMFIGTISCLVLHAPIEKLLGLEKNTLLLGTALAAGAISLFLTGSKARDFFSRRVDWWTLSFFMALFACVGTLEFVGVTERIANGMIEFGQNNEGMLFYAFTAAVSLLTGFMDNVLAVATFIPILGEIQHAGVYIFPFWWAMLFGGTMFGNLTVIGSTANIVAMGMLEKDYGKTISFMDWLKPGIVVSLLTLIAAIILLRLQIPLMPH